MAHGLLNTPQGSLIRLPIQQKTFPQNK